MGLKWWEKTVEYHYVLRYLRAEEVIAPLDGKEERAGDAIAGLAEKWVLIEFKKDKSCIASEANKFTDFEAAKKMLGECDEHHFLVYGAVETSGAGEDLCLQARTYFSHKATAAETILKNGADYSKFREYLKTFLRLKVKGDDSGGGGGGAGGGNALNRYGLVAGVSKDGNFSLCMSLYEFAPELFPHSKPEMTLKRPKA